MELGPLWHGLRHGHPRPDTLLTRSGGDVQPGERGGSIRRGEEEERRGRKVREDERERRRERRERGRGRGKEANETQGERIQHTH